MNRFRPQPDRTCLEDLYAPVSHFTSCHREHEFMFRQLAQTHRQEVQIDPSIWERTANVWAGSAARARASLVQLAATFYGKCASVAAMVVLIAGLQLLPAPIKPSTSSGEQPATASAQNQNEPEQASSVATRRGASKTSSSPEVVAAAPAPAATSSVANDDSTDVTTPESEKSPEPSEPAPSPDPSGPDTETPPSSGSSNLISAEVLADEDPLVEVSLPGVSVKLL